VNRLWQLLRNPRRIVWATAGLLALCSSDRTSSVRAEERSIEHFETHIRPLLVAHCYECHSGNQSADAANLRLDRREGWLTGGDSGPAVDSEQPAESLLWRAVSYNDPDLQMPPRSKLPERELGLLRDWLAAGAPAPADAPGDGASPTADFDLEGRRHAHWVWRPVVRPDPPAVRDAAWPHDALDQFILARLEASGLEPAASADRATWLRRVTYDLTGLPPTPKELAEFLANDQRDSEAHVVDRLLARSTFGECWGQHWLDLVRFAETKGHEQDFPIPHVWRYRDYVVKALNENLPYDQFLVEHLAGDLLTTPRIDAATRTNQSIQATGFWHLGEATHSPVDIRGDEADRIDNQIDVFGKAFLGLTIACARCHDHKYDAISAEDYYGLCGFLQSSSYQEANIADPELREQLRAQLCDLNRTFSELLLASSRRESLSQLRTLLLEPNLSTLRQELAADLADAQDAPEHPLHLLAIACEAEQDGREVAHALDQALRQDLQQHNLPPAPHYQPVIDFSQAPRKLPHPDWRTSGHGFGEGPIRVGEIVLASVTGEPILRIQTRAAASNRMLGPKFTGMYRTRTFEITSPHLWVCYRGEADLFLDVDSHRTVAGPLHGTCRQTLAPASDWKWHRHEVGAYLAHRVHLEFIPRGPFELAAVAFADQPPVIAELPGAAIGRIIRETQPRTFPETALAYLRAFETAFEAVEEQRADAGDARLLNWLLATNHRLCSPPADSAMELQALAATYQTRRDAIEAQLPAPQYALAMLDGSGENEYVHLRGSHKRVAAEATERRFLAALDGDMQIPQGSGRLELAHRVVDPANPLTSRVAVNRVWAHLTGEGIVKTVDNLGVLGEKPTHPELLDFLAAEFVESGWNLKQLIRRIVLSSTYRQSCRPHPRLTPEQIAIADPANALLHHARVRRIPAEAIRDAMLAVSGELDNQQFGPSVPIHLTPFMRHNRSPSHSGPLDGDRRRSIYLEYRRNALNHFLTAFDKPQPSTTVGRRNESNSPAQPLMLLNDPLVHALAARWATQLTSQFADDADALQVAWQAAYGREPDPSERQRVSHLLQSRMTAEEESVLLTVRERAWRDVCLALFNSKEFIFLR
jgi:hypothetical protein